MMQVRTAREFSATETAEMVRAGAKQAGNLNRQAATELLIQHDVWLRRPDFRDLIEVYTDGGKDYGVIRWKLIAAALQSEESVVLVESASALRILRIATSIVIGELYDLVTGFDKTNIALVLRAMAHANGNTKNAKVWVGAQPPGSVVRLHGHVIYDPAETPAIDIWDAPDITDPHDVLGTIFPGGE
jgi:hypothetical protein